jgi:hypothetical protein
VSEQCYRNWLWLCFTFDHKQIRITSFSHSSFISGVTVREIRYSIIVGPQFFEDRILKFIFHIILDRLLGDVWTINLQEHQKLIIWSQGSLKVHISNVFFLFVQGKNSILSPKTGSPEVGPRLSDKRGGFCRQSH